MSDLDLEGLRRLADAITAGPAEITRVLLPRVAEDAAAAERALLRLVAGEIPGGLTPGLIGLHFLPPARRDAQLLRLMAEGEEAARVRVLELAARNQKLPPPGSLRPDYPAETEDRLLRAGLADPSPRVRERAVAWAYGLGRIAAHRDAILAGLSDADEACRGYCLLALGVLDDPASRARLGDALAHGSAREATAAVWALARRPDGIAAVVASVDDARPDLRREALGAIIHVAVPLDEEALARLQAADRPAEVRAAAARHLARVRGGAARA
jgi:hypothetical protein